VGKHRPRLRPEAKPAIAYRMDLSGDISEKGRAWVFDEKNTPDTCTPAAFDGKFYALNGDKQTMTCLDAKTGAKVCRSLQPRPQQGRRNLPFLADDCRRQNLQHRRERHRRGGKPRRRKVIASIPMGGGNATRSSIAVSDGHLFIRTSEKLWCIGK